MSHPFGSCAKYRYDPEYRKIRERYSLLDICAQPELCAEVTLMPVRKLGVDAAILFSDIMVPVGAMGLEFTIRENVGYYRRAHPYAGRHRAAEAICAQ
nr:uroporphyrinogen decarboxylase family protein [Alicyclobacillus sacchari]